MSVLTIPQVCLVALVGVSGSGKSTFAARHFGRYEVVSSDVCRGMVSDDENDQSATPAAFELLAEIVRQRLRAGRLTVVDATNVQRDARRQLVDLAREHDVLPVAIVLDVPESLAARRNEDRADRQFGSKVVARQAAQLRRSRAGLQREGFRVVHTLNGVADIDAAQIKREKLRVDLTDRCGPFDVIGDVHGCLGELLILLGELGYQVVRDELGRPIDASHPDGRTVVFLGDLVDRGPDSPGVLRLAMGMTAAGHALAVPGNHENKLVRALSGRQVQRTHGLAETLAQLDAESEEFRTEVRQWCDCLVSHLVLDEGRLVVAHAGLKEAYHGRASGRVRSFALYGETTGETDEFGLPVRYPWADDYRGRATVLYGHTPVPQVQWHNSTLCLDTGCVFGGQLSALRYPEREVVSVAAQQVWYEPTRPLQPARDGDDLQVSDVLGARVIETAHLGRVSVRAENAAAALEVLSRFSLHPRWVPYLPPTMSPVATSAREDLLEHPDEAFTAYAGWGVERVICEEKHMGSRAVVLVCRSAEAAQHRFGAGWAMTAAGEAGPDQPEVNDETRTGAIYTRTGRAFLGNQLTEAVLARLRAAAERSGLWDELQSDWLLFDAEIMPWSVKADQLIKDQYAGLRAAAQLNLSAASAALEQAAARGLDVQALRERTLGRLANLDGFAAAYRGYRWPVAGLTGLRIAPFQLLASQGATCENRDHGWHLELAQRLASADPELLCATRHLVVELGSPEARSAGVAWWQELTEAGGEGMVVKPWANLTRGRSGLVQPGVKVRGREYLRLIYGPDYTDPANLARLRERQLGRKRSLALREYALGLEALARLAAGEPLWRVHEPVFAVLALESEPVDPRL